MAVVRSKVDPAGKGPFAVSGKAYRQAYHGPEPFEHALDKALCYVLHDEYRRREVSLEAGKHRLEDQRPAGRGAYEHCPDVFCLTQRLFRSKGQPSGLAPAPYDPDLAHELHRLYEFAGRPLVVRVPDAGRLFHYRQSAGLRRAERLLYLVPVVVGADYHDGNRVCLHYTARGLVPVHACHADVHGYDIRPFGL